MVLPLELKGTLSAIAVFLARRCLTCQLARLLAVVEGFAFLPRSPEIF
ncbi:hypothetical protein [Phormidium sp. CCY1219]|nr:hypothetical protein [Phormidium sp. CCY1219]MEB3828215.1 hypothetical protein [Phormidium sp. CCY1219]